MGKIIDRIRKRECALIIRQCEQKRIEDQRKQSEWEFRKARETAAMQNVAYGLQNMAAAQNALLFSSMAGLQNSEEAKRWNKQCLADFAREPQSLSSNCADRDKWWKFW